MPGLTCPQCETQQDVSLTPDTYVVECAYCGNDFDIPREHRINKRELQEYTSRVNIRIGFTRRGDTIEVAWTVQSAEKRNQYLEQESVAVDVANHPQKTYWYVAIFKALQHINEYKSARIWVKHEQVIDHLSGEFSTPDDDLRTQLVQSITQLCDDKFLGCEFGVADHVGGDIQKMLS